jgi:hypothetical protein
MQLADQDIIFFQKPANWRGAPAYELTIVVDAHEKPANLNNIAINSGALHLLSPKEEIVPLKTILQIGEGFPLVGLFHTFIYRPFDKCSTYHMSIFPSQFQRFADFGIGVRWSKFDLDKLQALHRALIGLVRKMDQEVTIFGATIADDSQRFVLPSVSGRAICLDKDLAELLHLDGKPLSIPLAHFVAVNF